MVERAQSFRLRTSAQKEEGQPKLAFFFAVSEAVNSRPRWKILPPATVPLLAIFVAFFFGTKTCPGCRAHPPHPKSFI